VVGSMTPTLQIAQAGEFRTNGKYRAEIEEDPEQRGAWRVRMQRLKNGQACPVHTHTGLLTRELAIHAAEDLEKKR